jgi:Bacterial PH domain
MSDFDFDTKHGLPEALPQGERLLWQGKPHWVSLAINAFHVRKVMIYFAGLAVAQAGIRLMSGATAAEAARAFLWLVPLGLAAAGILTLLAWASARTTTYTLTSRRVVLRVGIALPVTINIPFKQIDGASLAVTGKGAGDLCFRVNDGNRLAYLLLWPHAKPWKFTRPEPGFRAIPNVDKVADLAAKALAAAPSVQATAPADTRVAALLAAAE